MTMKEDFRRWKSSEVRKATEAMSDNDGLLLRLRSSAMTFAAENHGLSKLSIELNVEKFGKRLLADVGRRVRQQADKYGWFIVPGGDGLTSDDPEDWAKADALQKFAEELEALGQREGET